jgi:hypothetical protein
MDHGRAPLLDAVADYHRLDQLPESPPSKRLG